MANNDVVVSADRIRKWHKTGRFIKLSILLLLLLLIIIYIVLRITFSDGSFIVSLRSNDILTSGMVMYESLNDPTAKRKLSAGPISFMDNIDEKWIPANVNEFEGSHNGDNYIAYTFYIENQGEYIFNYWYQMFIDDVVNMADEIVWVKVFEDDVEVEEPSHIVKTFAKGTTDSMETDSDTIPFREDKDGTIILEKVGPMKPGDIKRMTIVVWIQGPDHDAIDARIGGELRMHMDITEEHIGVE